MHEVETMAFTGEVPWHGLGNKVNNTMSPSEMLVASGCDWKVQLTANHYPPDHAVHPSEPVPNSQFIERESDGSILGEYVTGNDYKVVQNEEMFEFFGEFLADDKMYLHTAGSLFGGKKVWAMASCKEGFTLGKDDTVVNNVLFTINHTGREANTALVTPIRVVCNNTMRLAMKDGKNDIVKHNHRVQFDAEVMKTALGIYTDAFGEFELLAQAMAKRVLEGNEEVDFFRKVFGGKEREADGKIIHSLGVRKALAYNRGQEFVAIGANKNVESKQNQIDRLSSVIEAIKKDAGKGKKIDQKRLEQLIDSDALVGGGADDEKETTTPSVLNPGWDNESSEGTLWGSFQTVMFMADHKPIKDYGVDHRFEKAMYGAAQGLDVKEKALKTAKELIAA